MYTKEDEIKEAHEVLDELGIRRDYNEGEATLATRIRELAETLSSQSNTAPRSIEERVDVLKKEIERLRAALRLIGLIESKRNMHLGRPRSSATNCIFCIAYLAENYGAYGEYLEKEDFEKAIEYFAK